MGCVERVSARLSEDARNGWDRAVVTTGSSFTALIEAIGLALHERSLELPAEVVERANRIDLERNSRRRR